MDDEMLTLLHRITGRVGADTLEERVEKLEFLCVALTLCLREVARRTNV